MDLIEGYRNFGNDDDQLIEKEPETLDQDHERIIQIMEELPKAVIGKHIEERLPYKDFDTPYLQNEIQVMDGLTWFQSVIIVLLSSIELVFIASMISFSACSHSYTSSVYLVIDFMLIY